MPAIRVLPFMARRRRACRRGQAGAGGDGSSTEKLALAGRTEPLAEARRNERPVRRDHDGARAARPRSCARGDGAACAGIRDADALAYAPGVAPPAPATLLGGRCDDPPRARVARGTPSGVASSAAPRRRGHLRAARSLALSCAGREVGRAAPTSGTLDDARSPQRRFVPARAARERSTSAVSCARGVARSNLRRRQLRQNARQRASARSAPAAGTAASRAPSERSRTAVMAGAGSALSAGNTQPALPTKRPSRRARSSPRRRRRRGRVSAVHSPIAPPRRQPRVAPRPRRAARASGPHSAV